MKDWRNRRTERERERERSAIIGRLSITESAERLFFCRGEIGEREREEEGGREIERGREREGFNQRRRKSRLFASRAERATVEMARVAMMDEWKKEEEEEEKKDICM